MKTRTLSPLVALLALAVLLCGVLALAAQKVTRTIMLGLQSSKDMRVAEATTCPVNNAADGVHFVGCSSIL